jgi:hypothetical protein
MARIRVPPKAAAAFLQALAQGLSIAAAARAADVARSTPYRWRADAAFSDAFAHAVEAGTDRLEDEALRRAVEGVDKPVYRNGQLVGHVKDMSDSLLLALLAARRPEKFRTTSKTEHAGRMDAVREGARAALDRKLARLAGRTSAPRLPGEAD